MVISQSKASSAHIKNQQQNIKNYENAVFVSYAWGNESERNVDDLERTFAERDISIVRDKKNLDYKGSIEAFEQRIGRGQCIVLVISDKYLRSEHCMHELLMVNENRNLRERIFPIVLADARIYRPIDRLNYIKYWDEKIEKLNLAIKEIDVITNLASIIADLEKYARIRNSFDYLTNLLSDMNALTPEMHTANGFSTLINAVECSVGEKKDVTKYGAVIYQPKMYIASKENKTWEEFATFLPKTAPDTDKLMFAAYYRSETENNEMAETKTITTTYFRRARWHRPINLSATANYCASKGWLSEVGRVKSQKLWRITKLGYETVNAKMNQI
jgi:hypothetical protein